MDRNSRVGVKSEQSRGKYIAQQQTTRTQCKAYQNKLRLLIPLEYINRNEKLQLRRSQASYKKIRRRILNR